MSKGSKIDSFLMFIFVVYCIAAAIIIIYVQIDLSKSTFNNTNSSLYMTLEYLIIPVLILGGLGLLILIQKISDIFK